MTNSRLQKKKKTRITEADINLGPGVYMFTKHDQLMEFEPSLLDRVDSFMLNIFDIPITRRINNIFCLAVAIKIAEGQIYMSIPITRRISNIFCLAIAINIAI